MVKLPAPVSKCAAFSAAVGAQPLLRPLTNNEGESKQDARKPTTTANTDKGKSD